MSIKRFEIFKGEDGRIYFHASGDNGEIVVDSEGYERRQGALGGVLLTLTIPPDVEIVDLTGDSPVFLTADEVRELAGADADEVVDLTGETVEALG